MFLLQAILLYVIVPYMYFVKMPFLLKMTVLVRATKKVVTLKTCLCCHLNVHFSCCYSALVTLVPCHTNTTTVNSLYSEFKKSHTKVHYMERFTTSILRDILVVIQFFNSLA